MQEPATERAGKPRGRAKAKAAAPRLVTRSEAAAVFGVVPSRINRWAAEGAPVARHGRPGHGALYDLEALRGWRAARQEAPEGGLSLSDERAKLARAQREKTEMANALTAGFLVEREAVVAEGRAHVTAAKARILAVSRLAVLQGIIPPEREGALRRLLLEALAELAAWKTLEDVQATVVRLEGPAE